VSVLRLEEGVANTAGGEDEDGSLFCEIALDNKWLEL
jgi:hypothetical protein